MARTKGSALGKWRGRVGGITYYVRHGRQVVYAPDRSRPRSMSARQLELSDAVRMAHRWKTQLDDEGVPVEFGALLKWAHAVLRVRDGGGAESIFQSSGGSWSLPFVTIVDGNVTTSINVRNAALGSVLRQPWGRPWVFNPGWTTWCVFDFVRNVYPSGCLFVSVRGASIDDCSLAIGRRVDWNGNYNQSTVSGAAARLYSMAYTSQSAYGWIYRYQGMPTPRNYGYTISGWQPPSLPLGHGVLAWAVITADGVIVDMAVAPAS